MKLDWCEIAKNPNYYDECSVTDVDGKEEMKLKDLKFDYVIGSDIVYWTNSIVPLMNVLTVSLYCFYVFKALFERNSTLVFYICYIERVSNVHKELLSQFQLNGFKFSEEGQDLTKPLDPNSYIYRVTK